jgi:hypothetical protein
MSREQIARCPLSADQLPLLALHRHLPQRSLPELLVASERVNDPVRLALFHAQGCAPCSAGEPCERGARLMDGCHAWRIRATQ